MPGMRSRLDQPRGAKGNAPGLAGLTGARQRQRDPTIVQAPCQELKGELMSDQEDPRRVYLISDESGRVKIGVSNDIDGRLRSLQTANPEKLTLLATCHGGEALEKRLHERYEDRRLEREWFKLKRGVVGDLILEIEAKSGYPEIDWASLRDPHIAGIDVQICAVVSWGELAWSNVSSAIEHLAVAGMEDDLIMSIILFAHTWVHFNAVANVLTLPFDENKE